MVATVLRMEAHRNRSSSSGDDDDDDRRWWWWWIVTSRGIPREYNGVKMVVIILLLLGISPA